MFEAAEDPPRPAGEPASRHLAAARQPAPSTPSTAADQPTIAPTSFPEVTIAFLLAQLGQHAADRLTARIAELDLTPPQAGILHAIAGAPGRSQQALSEQLNLLPSRVVAFVDELEKRELLQRRRNPADRRLYALYLTERGEQVMAELAAVAGAHEEELTAGLTDQQRTVLTELLVTVADHQHLQPAGASGYSTLLRTR